MITGVGQLAASAQANGSRLTYQGKVVGSSLIGQSFTTAKGVPLPQWFQSRPSAAGTGYDGASSSGSNLGPNNPALVQAIDQRKAVIEKLDGVTASQIPADAVTASGSGLDPHISPAYALIQIDAVAKARGLDPAVVRKLVDSFVQNRDLGYLGNETRQRSAAEYRACETRPERQQVGRSDMGHARLRVLLGAAPGVGKTYTMLEEGRRLHDLGRDVIVAVVETHDRAATAAMLAGLEVIPRMAVSHRGVELSEMDLDAVIARHPEIALVDELAHTNAPGSRNEKQWQDVEELLAAGIRETTVNVQHIESLNDVVEQITGVPQRETVPDAIVRSADQVEIVDLAPQALRDRLADGQVSRRPVSMRHCRTIFGWAI